MIPFDFEYYRPDNIEEAAELFGRLNSEGKAPVYYGGGSELISMARVGNLMFGSVIDIKGIPECRVMGIENGMLQLGSALTLYEIVESNAFPLLGKTAGRIADHTMQCKITLGGNLSSSIIYREASLPLLLADAKLTAAGPNGLREYDMKRLFKGRLDLPKGEFLVKVSIAGVFLELPYYHVKKTKLEKIDYPLITAAGLKANGRICIAFSGLCPYPFRDSGVEDILNDTSQEFELRSDKIVRSLSGKILNDLNGSSEYRAFVLKNTLENILESLKDM